MPRLFTAIEIGERERQVLSLLRGGLTGARWIEPSDYHVTLRFLGDVDHRTAGEVADALSRTERPAFTLRLSGLDAFGGRQPTSVHAVVERNEALAELQAEHERIARRVGLKPDTRRFMPHVTLARMKGVSPEAVAAWLSLRGGFASLPFAVDRFVLMSSRDSVGGGPYVIEARFPLAGAPTGAGMEDRRWSRS